MIGTLEGRGSFIRPDIVKLYAEIVLKNGEKSCSGRRYGSTNPFRKDKPSLSLNVSSPELNRKKVSGFTGARKTPPPFVRAAVTTATVDRRCEMVRPFPGSVAGAVGGCSCFPAAVVRFSPAHVGVLPLAILLHAPGICIRNDAHARGTANPPAPANLFPATIPLVTCVTAGCRFKL